MYSKLTGLDTCDDAPAPLSALSPWRAVNSYGLFAVMTTERFELTVEGSQDGLRWREYVFPFKPSDPNIAPRWATPHQPRLDWQMWFAALGEPRHAPWMFDFAFALLERRPDVLKLIEDPFAGETPTFIRVTSSRYTFTSQHERTMTGHWWNTGQRQVWLEPIRLRRPVITHEPLELDE